MKYDYVIDFKNEVQKTIDGEPHTVLQFYEKSKPALGNKKEILEYAYIRSDAEEITYKTEDGNINYLNKKLLNDFIFNLYNQINTSMIGENVLSKSKSSKPFYQMKILGKSLPLAVFLLINRTSYKTAFATMDLNYQFKDKKDNEAGVVLNFKDSEDKRWYLCLYPKTSQQWNYAHGLGTFKLKTRTLDPTIEGLSAALYQIVTDLYGQGFAKNLIEIENKFIDGSTKKILEDGGFSTDLAGVFSHDMVELLGQRTAKSQYDLDNFRLRMSETITSVAYKQMHQAMSKFKTLKHLSKEKITMKNDYIIKNLLDAGILQQTKTLNPVEEMMLSLKVTKTGIGNTLKSQVTLNRRDINPSYFGMLAPTATNEYGGIGINQTLTNGAMIDDRFGNISKKPFSNDTNSFANLSPIESLSPFFEYDDTTRRVMGNQQTGQFVQLEKPDVPMVQTGFESYVPSLVSDRFVKKAKQDGKVLSVNDETVKIRYKDGSTETISTRAVKSRTKRGIFIATNYNVLVNKDQNVVKGQSIAVTDSLKTGKLAIGRNLVVAEMGYLGMNYEDGWAVSDVLDTKYSNKILQKINIKLPAGSKLMELNLSEGNRTNTGDVLIKYNTSVDFIDDDDGSDDFESAMIGLETNGLTKIYRSPGGIIKEIVVKINNKAIPKEVIALHKKLTTVMQEKLDACKLQTNKLDKDVQQEEYTNCIGHVENVEALSIGGHKLNQEEIDGAIIEVYIEKENHVINGSKFTLASSGGKGTVQYIMKHGMEPVAMDSGLKIEFIGTPLSIISRKNPSILLNMYLGKVIYYLNKVVVELVKTKKILAIKKLVQEVFSHLDKTSDGIIMSQLEDFFKQPHSQIIKIINSSDPLQNPAFPAIVPPFKNKINIGNIMEAAKVLGVKLNEKVMVPENNGIVTEREVPVGILPIYMLEHFPQAMSSTRGSLSTSSSFITGQGRSGTKEGTGAIKVGEYDLKSLLSKRPYGLIKEMHAMKSDATKAKKQMINTILRTNEIPNELDITVDAEDLTSMNMVKTFFIGAGLDSRI
jgi:DNA-directed RNA polymerase beta subunit